MNKRNIIRKVLEGSTPPYVPWSIGYTIEMQEKLLRHFNVTDAMDLEDIMQNHIIFSKDVFNFCEDIGDNYVKDVFGVVWDRSVDRDIGTLSGLVLEEPTLKNYEFPDPLDKRFFLDIPEMIKKYKDRFRIFLIGFSLYERAWSLRGMENLLMDMLINPKFVRELLGSITDYNISKIKELENYDIDAVCFGDDWGYQNGLQMGIPLWHKFIFPELKRMYKEVKKIDRFVYIHCCGDVDELFDDLISIGLNCFNPFQPEVMDVFDLLEKYRGKLAFHGGMSTQYILPFASEEVVKNETRKLIRAGLNGSYIFSPAHSMKDDVPIKNILAFLEVIQNQKGI